MFGNTIVEDKKNLDELMVNLKKQLENLKCDHIMFTKTNKQKSFLFGLDPLYFQHTLLSAEYEHFNKHYSLIKNRMYCENYKLLKLMTLYINDHLIDKNSVKKPNTLREFSDMANKYNPFKTVINKSLTVNDTLDKFIDKLSTIVHGNKFTTYKENDPYANYDFTEIMRLYKINISIIDCLKDVAKKQKHSLTEYRTTHRVGFNINNFIVSFEHEVESLDRQICVFMEYIRFMNTTHSKNIIYLTTKIVDILAQIEQGVYFGNVACEEPKTKNNIDMNIDNKGEEIQTIYAPTDNNESVLLGDNESISSTTHPNPCSTEI